MKNISVIFVSVLFFFSNCSDQVDYALVIDQLRRSQLEFSDEDVRSLIRLKEDIELIESNNQKTHKSLRKLYQDLGALTSLKSEYIDRINQNSEQQGSSPLIHQYLSKLDKIAVNYDWTCSTIQEISNDISVFSTKLDDIPNELKTQMSINKIEFFNRYLKHSLLENYGIDPPCN